MSDVELAVDRLQELRDMGFKVSPDVTDAWRGGRDGAIAMSVIALGRAFN